VKKIKSISMVLVLLGLNLSAQNLFITTQTTQVAPGVIHKKVLEPREPWTLNVLEIDLSNPFIEVESIKAGDRLGSGKRTSEIILQRSFDGHRVVGGINGDYFDTAPINTQVVDGEILKLENITSSNPIYWPSLCLDYRNRPSIGTTRFSGYIGNNAAAAEITEVNHSRATNAMILYNKFIGGSTGTNASGVEVLIAPVGEWFVNDTILCVVEKKETGVGNMAILPGKSVLSGAGSDSTFLADNIEVGDTIRFYIGLATAIPKMKYSIGGFPTIVRDGQNYAVEGYYAEGGGSTFHTELHPRTGVGFSADSSKLIFVTVDGRQSSSRGMSLIELADFMISQGVWKGMNLDGGGSTTMVVRGDVENSPSDGGERSVSNALATYSTAPDGELSAIQIEPDNIRTFLDNKTQFVVSGWDRYFNPIELDPNLVKFSVDPALGSIDENDRFVATGYEQSGYVYVRYNSELIDSARVYLKQVTTLSLTPRACMIDMMQPLTFQIRASDEDGLQQSIAARQLEWISLDPSVATVDSTGTLKGVSAGTTQIVASYHQVSETVFVTVGVPEGVRIVDEMDRVDHWTLSGENYNAENTRLSVVDTPRTTGTGAFCLDYNFIAQSGAFSRILLNTDVFISGESSSIEIDFQSDGYKHLVEFITKDANDKEFAISTKQYATQTNYTWLIALLSGINDESFTYPFRITGIRIKLGKSANYGEISSGTLYLDNLRVNYSDYTQVIPLDDSSQPEAYRLHQNYPNPFNPTTLIRYELPRPGFVTLAVYNMMGQEMRTLIHKYQNSGNYEVTLDASDFGSGVYFYRLQAGDFREIRKMILLK